MPKKPTGEGKKLKLTVFLIKKDYMKTDGFLEIEGDYDILEIKKEEKTIGELIYKGGFKSEPGWVSIFEDIEGFDKKKLYNQSSKGLFVLKHKDRYLCFTFGHSRHLINQLSYERNFGLKVALNSSDPESIKSIDKTNISHIALHSREQSTKDIEFGGFEFDFDIDILKSITAKVEKDDEEETETISGRDSVSIYTRVDLNSFPKIADELLNAYSNDKYKKNYPWIDYIQEVRDKDILERLDSQVVEHIVQNNYERIWLAVPDVLYWHDVKGFANKKKEIRPDKPGPVLRDDLDISSWVVECKIDEKLTAESLKKKKVYLYWEDDRPPTTLNVYKCMNAELDHDGDKYILNDGAWYNIQGDYVKNINQFYQDIPDSVLNLPNFGAMNEPDYLVHVTGNDNHFALMDRQNIMLGGGRNRIEFCDLYSRDRDIVHVKKYGGSSVLSHLFQQSLVSGECFLHEPEFRQKLNDKLPDGFKLNDPAALPIPSDYPIHLAVMSKVAGPLELPFFSKVSIRYTVKHLRNLGFGVAKLKIDR